MINYDTIKKYFPDENDLDEMYNYQHEPMAFPWLDDVKQWLEETFGARILTIAYKQNENTHLFYVFLWYWDDMDKIPYAVDKKLFELRIRTAEKRISEYLHTEEKEEIVCLIAPTSFDSKVRGFIKQKAFDVREKTAKLFEHLKPCYLSNSGDQCVLKTRDEAKAFLLSDDYQNIRKQLFVILKKLDKYDIFKEKDVRIFVDYKENMDKTPMWVMWANELCKEEMDKYENSIING